MSSNVRSCSTHLSKNTPSMIWLFTFPRMASASRLSPVPVDRRIRDPLIHEIHPPDFPSSNESHSVPPFGTGSLLVWFPRVEYKRHVCLAQQGRNSSLSGPGIDSFVPHLKPGNHVFDSQKHKTRMSHTLRMSTDVRQPHLAPGASAFVRLGYPNAPGPGRISVTSIRRSTFTMLIIQVLELREAINEFQSPIYPFRCLRVSTSPMLFSSVSGSCTSGRNRNRTTSASCSIASEPRRSESRTQLLSRFSQLRESRESARPGMSNTFANSVSLRDALMRGSRI